MSSSRTAKMVLNYRVKRGRLLKRVLDEVETGLTGDG